MKFFLDTANLDEIRQAAALGIRVGPEQGVGNRGFRSSPQRQSERNLMPS